MTRPAAIAALIVLSLAVGCAPRRSAPPAAAPAAAAAGWALVHPPQVRDDRYPHGVRLQTKAPVHAWKAAATFATAEACETSRHTRIDDAIDRARAAKTGEPKNDVTVRLAVNARCVPTR